MKISGPKGEKDEEVSLLENRKFSEVGRQVFRAEDIITKLPQKFKSFENLTMINNNNSSPTVAVLHQMFNLIQIILHKHK